MIAWRSSLVVPQGSKRTAVLGYPIRHSLSPRLHEYWLKKYHIAGSYEAIEVAPETLEQTLCALSEEKFAGVNLTVPHKEKALLLVDELDEIARRIGAINTIIVRNSKLFGTNTDAYGFIKNLNARAPRLVPEKAVVLGAGGAARAVCVGLLDEGWKVTLLNRTREKAEALADFLKHEHIKVQAWEHYDKIIADASLLVNTTTLGMKGQPAVELSLHNLPVSATVYDIVYSPLITPLLALAQARGNPIITGLGMLLYQAQPAFDAWFAVKPEVTQELYEYVLEGLA